ncbi:MAG: tetratricopeptide repeat protein [Bacteroidota bacterium]
MKKTIFIFSLMVLLCNPSLVLAQAEPDDIALANDSFQESFYESLTQKGIENYDKAITALEKCLTLQPSNATVYFELGKNYLAQRDYKKSYESFEKATKIDATNRWFWVGMYDVCYETRDFEQAIIIVLKLVEFKKEYKEELVSLYMNTQRFDEALTLINELNDNVGKTTMRDNYKAQILRDPKYQSSERNNLIDQIRKNPKEESNYFSLIYLYNENKEYDKAAAVAKQLETEIPNSDWSQVNLFTLHLNNNDGESAVKAMNRILASSKIDRKVKHRILNDFLIFIKDKPQFDADLEKAIPYFDNDKEVKVAKEIGKFYQNRQNWAKAIQYYQIHLNKNPEDIEAILLSFQSYTNNKQFDILAKNAEIMTQLYPTQPEFYYFTGLANNQLGQFKKAKDSLETGIDFLVSDIDLEINFNIQLGEAYNGLGDVKKKENYFSIADKLLKQKK